MVLFFDGKVPALPLGGSRLPWQGYYFALPVLSSEISSLPVTVMTPLLSVLLHNDQPQQVLLPR